MYDKVKRVVLEAHRKKRIEFVKRVRCRKCSMIHRMLPANVLYQKHYDRRIVFGIVKGRITESHPEFEDFPSEATRLRWLREYEIDRNSSIFM